MNVLHKVASCSKLASYNANSQSQQSASDQSHLWLISAYRKALSDRSGNIYCFLATAGCIWLIWPTALKQRVSNITWETSTGKSKAGTQKHNHHTLWVFTNSTRVLHIEISPQAFRAGKIWWSSHCVSVTSPDAGIRKEEEEEEEEPVNIVRFNWMCLEESLVLKTVNLWVGTYRGNWKTHTRLYINSFHFPWSHTTGVIKRQHNTKVINDAVCLLFNL